MGIDLNASDFHRFSLYFLNFGIHIRNLREINHFSIGIYLAFHLNIHSIMYFLSIFIGHMFFIKYEKDIILVFSFYLKSL